MNIQTPFWNLFEFEIRLKDIIFATSQILCLPFSIMHQFRIGQKRWANFGPSDYLFYKKIIETSINEMMLVAMTFKVITNACLIYLFDSLVNYYQSTSKYPFIWKNGHNWIDFFPVHHFYLPLFHFTNRYLHFSVDI